MYDKGCIFVYMDVCLGVVVMVQDTSALSCVQDPICNTPSATPQPCSLSPIITIVPGFTHRCCIYAFGEWGSPIT